MRFGFWGESCCLWDFQKSIRKQAKAGRKSPKTCPSEAKDPKPQSPKPTLNPKPNLCRTGPALRPGQLRERRHLVQLTALELPGVRRV